MMNMTERDTLLSIYSDVHKDAYGFRPREGAWAKLKSMSDSQIAQELELLGAVAVAEMHREEREEAAAIAELKAEVEKMMSDYGISRSDAYRWLVQSEGGYCDFEQFLWRRGCGCGRAAYELMAEVGPIGPAGPYPRASKKK